MPVLISGVLKDGTGTPVQNCTIQLKAKRNSTTVVVNTLASENPDEAGRYSMDVEYGQYSVILLVEGFPPSHAGTITVYEDSQPGTLNDFLGAATEDDVRPEALRRFELMVEEVARNASAVAQNTAAAKKSASDASTSASEAATHATDAADSARAAGSSARDAAASKEAAKSSETNAAASQQSATTSASTATTKASEAAISASTAGDAAKAAKLSETNAKASETSAASSVTAAENSAKAAKTSETNAKSSETAAAESASAAAGSETAAASSESAASTSAGQAAVSATAAEKSAESASSSASSAASSASSASASKDEATRQASAAKESASTASTKAAEAADSAKASATSASNAGKSASSAADEAKGAKASAGAAADSAKASATSAADAEKSASDAEAAAQRATGGLLGVRVITASCEYTPPGGVGKIIVDILGGGGGVSGVSCSSGDKHSMSGGAGAAGHIRTLIDVAKIQSLTLIVGAPGGESGVKGNGAWLRAGPGYGPTPRNDIERTAFDFASGGAGGWTQCNIPAGCDGITVILEQHGANGKALMTFSSGLQTDGEGAGTFAGCGGDCTYISQKNSPTGYGSGAGGYHCFSAGNSLAATPGAPGVIIIQEYA